MIIFSYSTGEIISDDGDVLDAGCYAGSGVGKNNPAMQSVKDVGPLPVGMYTLQAPVDTAEHGPFVIWLTPDKDDEMYGRAGFGMHSDRRIGPPGFASFGCLVCLLAKRQAIWAGGHRRLRVTI